MPHVAITHLAFAAAVLVAPACSQAPRFARPPVSHVAVGQGSGQVLLADVDHDGHVDLLTQHLLTLRVTVNLGDGAGHFRPAPGSPMLFDFMPAGIALGDLDLDGNVDLVVCGRDRGNEQVDVHLGDGHGAFRRAPGAPRATAAAIELYKPRLRLADVNGDGALDVVVANGRRNTIEILLGDNQAKFTTGPVVTLAADQDYRSFELGDVDGDGRLDVVIASSAPGPGAGRVTTLRGDGSGAFAIIGAPLAVPSGARILALDDVDGDRRADLVLGHDDTRLLSVLRNDGAGTFAPMRGSPFELERSSYAAVAADVTRDGQIDLIVSTVDPDVAPFESALVYLHGAHGTFVPADEPTILTAPGAYNLAAADLDGDARLDVVTSSFESDAVTVIRGM